MEIEMPERPFSVETLERLNTEWPNDEIFFVMGADSWMEITAWRDWEKVLTMTNHIVVTRPGTQIDLTHITHEIRGRIIDLRNSNEEPKTSADRHIYLTDVAQVDVSATNIRQKLLSGDASWRADVAPEVAKYIDKYQIYS
jgi:nicotinate-nucleotide adenylyltransferase